MRDATPLYLSIIFQICEKILWNWLFIIKQISFTFYVSDFYLTAHSEYNEWLREGHSAPENAKRMPETHFKNQ